MQYGRANPIIRPPAWGGTFGSAGQRVACCKCSNASPFPVRDSLDRAGSQETSTSGRGPVAVERSACRGRHRGQLGVCSGLGVQGLRVTSARQRVRKSRCIYSAQNGSNGSEPPKPTGSGDDSDEALAKAWEVFQELANSGSMDAEDDAAASDISSNTANISAEDLRNMSGNTAYGDNMSTMFKKGGRPTSKAPSILKLTWGRVLYNYYNWRKDTWSDLQLFTAINVAFLLLGGLIKRTIVDGLEGQDAASHPIWLDFYSVLVVVFGQEMPDAAASFIEQAFSLAVAGVGLASFALVLAFVEQVVLEVVESNVKRGSKVYETGHMVVLCWGENQRDLELAWKILAQICLAYRNDGGKVVVILSEREKLEMEAMFRRTIPESQRFGTRFVFRQGSPLVPEDLRMVSVSTAQACMVISDHSRTPDEADSQVLRTGILIDELDFPGYGVTDTRTGHVVCELKTMNAVHLMQYSCSSRIIGLPSGQLNSRRIARMVTMPLVAVVSQQLWSFNSDAQAYMEYFPQLKGVPFGKLAFYFDNGLVLGLYNGPAGRCLLNPPPGTLVQEGDHIVMMHPNEWARGKYQPMKEPKRPDLANWKPNEYIWKSQDDMPMGINPDVGSDINMGLAPASNMSATGNDSNAVYVMPAQYTASTIEPERILICGWGEASFMIDLLRELDQGPGALPPGSEVTLFNVQASERVLDHFVSQVEIRSLRVLHVRGNPLSRPDLRSKIDVTKYKTAIILGDITWIDPDMNIRNGIGRHEQSDMLRLDSMIMMVHLNIRKILEDSNYPDINIICEKLGFEGVTRFEDRYRLPLGISINLASFAAKMLIQCAYCPTILKPYAKLGEQSELYLQDVSAFAAEDEVLSFWQLQGRACSVGQVLFGYYEIPESVDRRIEMVINPQGDEVRSKKRVWNDGKARLKLVTLALKSRAREASIARAQRTFDLDRDQLPGGGAQVPGGAKIPVRARQPGK